MKLLNIEKLKELKSNRDIFILLFSISIFLPIVVSNVIVAILFLISIVSVKGKFQLTGALLLPIFFFLIIGVSFFWSIQPEQTLQSIPRNVFFIIIPLYFLCKSKILDKTFVVRNYSIFAVFVAVFFLLRAFIRFIVSRNTSYFFFHGDYSNDYGLVPKELNAIHISIFISVAFFYFFIKKTKNRYDVVAMLVLLVFLILLSSTNVILTTLLLSIFYFFYFSKQANRMRLRNITLVFFCLSAIFFYKKAERFLKIEFKTSINKGIGHNVIEELPNENHKVTLYEAWNNEKFTPNDFFPGMAFRVYQTRIFFEFLEQDSIFWKGFGFNASQSKIEKKGIEHNLFMGNKNIEGYQKKNFHNQYIQTFAELGIVGFLLFILLLFFSMKIAVKNKDFMHIAFTILMISVFLTESFLWRQRGVVFFTFFYCLFIVQKTKNK